jgi:hypothetical protein
MAPSPSTMRRTSLPATCSTWSARCAIRRRVGAHAARLRCPPEPVSHDTCSNISRTPLEEAVAGLRSDLVEALAEAGAGARNAVSLPPSHSCTSTLRTGAAQSSVPNQ